MEKREKMKKSNCKKAATESGVEESEISGTAATESVAEVGEAIFVKRTGYQQSEYQTYDNGRQPGHHSRQSEHYQSRGTAGKPSHQRPVNHHIGIGLFGRIHHSP